MVVIIICTDPVFPPIIDYGLTILALQSNLSAVRPTAASPICPRFKS